MIIDTRRRAECAQELTDRLDRLELNHAARFERLHSQQTEARVAIEDIRETLEDATSTRERIQYALMEQLQQIAKNPFIQLPNPGDFASRLGISVARGVSRTPTSFHYENKQEFTQKDDISGFRVVARYQQMLTKGTVAALEQQDYEDLSKIIGSDWASLAVHLGLSEGQTKRIKTSFARNDMPAIIAEVIRIWSDMEKETATIQRLIQAMLDCPVMNTDERAFDDIIKRHNRTA